MLNILQPKKCCQSLGFACPSESLHAGFRKYEFEIFIFAFPRKVNIFKYDAFVVHSYTKSGLGEGGCNSVPNKIK